MKVRQLTDHPEGGRYAEVYRSQSRVDTESGQSRCALTHIYFELQCGEVSRFHRVDSDEVWNLYEGQALSLYIWNHPLKTLEVVTLSSKNREYCHVVQAGMWQAAKAPDSNVLVGCSVAPGFEFDDFKLIQPASEIATSILANFPALAELIHP